MPTLSTRNETPAEATIPGGLILVFSTTHPLTKEQTNVHYHTQCAPSRAH